MFDVIGVGNLDVDIFIQIDKIPGQDEKTVATAHQHHVGGMVANTLVCLSRLGLKTVLHAPIGDDHYGETATAGMENEGVNISGLVQKKNGKTYFCVVVVDGTGEKSLIVVPTDCMDLEVDDFDNQVITSAKHMHTVLFDNVEIAIDVAKDSNMTISMDIEPNMLQGVSKARLHAMLKKVDILFVGETAAMEIIQSASPTECAATIQKLGPSIVCLTRGKNGGVIAIIDQTTEFNAYPVSPIDTTGAGDSFAAGFIYGYLKEWDIERSANFASAVAAFNTLSFGGHDGAPTLTQVTQFIADNPQ